MSGKVVFYCKMALKSPIHIPLSKKEINPFTSSGLFNYNSLNLSISSSMGVRLVFIITY